MKNYKSLYFGIFSVILGVPIVMAISSYTTNLEIIAEKEEQAKAEKELERIQVKKERMFNVYRI